MKRKAKLADAFWKFCNGAEKLCDMDQIFVMDEALDQVVNGCIALKEEAEMKKTVSESARELMEHLRGLGFQVTAVGVSGHLLIAYLSDHRQLTRTDRLETFLGYKVDYRYLGKVSILSS